MLTFDTLYFEQPYTGKHYPLLAKNINIKDTIITIQLDSRACFHDGTQVTAKDFIATVKTFKQHGLPYFSYHLKSLQDINIVDTYTVELKFQNISDKLFHFIASFPILSKVQLEKIKDFSNCQHIPLLGTGPYIIDHFVLGHNIQLKRNPQYWAKDFLIRKGKFNFDKMIIDYYKDYTSLFESFKKGYFDIVFDTDPQHFLNARFAHSGFKKLEFLYDNPYGSIQTLLLNKHRPFLNDKRVRQAIIQTFDFDMINRMFFYNRLSKANGIFGQKPALKSTMSSEQLLEKSGYRYKKGYLYRVNAKGETLELYALIRRRRFEKILNAFRDRLEHIGVKLNIIFLEDNLYKLYEQKKSYDIIWLTVNPEKNHIDTFINQFSNVVPLSVMKKQSAQEIEEHLKEQQLLIFMDYIRYIWVIYRQDRIAFPLSDKTGVNVMENGYAVS